MQHPNTIASPCPTNSASCSLTVGSITAGNLLVLVAGGFNSSSPPVFSSASGDGDTWTHCPNSAALFSASADSYVDCAYVLSSAGGGTTVTWNWNLNSTQFDIFLLEYSRGTGTAAFDVDNNSSAVCTNCTAPALTLTGSKDVVIAFAAPISTTITAISGAYTSPADFDGTNGYGVAGALNVTSYSAPSWTNTNQGVAQGIIAFK